ncbi:hypothetical protein [Parachitinimonas caeni]|uniref:Exo-alpha-sialidase n=1 Tax=Parachitinimonas caeni TaxID=3031301 RepID=A0ABT7DVR8_9NEIS|nr:hypothetical protein [Parachitinimonas caeni]MDK2124143.1 hypothetical protein [Parachitinimonas caeni]
MSLLTQFGGGSSTPIQGAAVLPVWDSAFARQYPGATVVAPALAPWLLKPAGSANGYACGGVGPKLVLLASNSTQALSSSDGQTFTPRTLPVAGNWAGRVAYGNGVYVAVGYGSAIAVSSSDGDNWSQRALPVSANWASCCFGAGLFLSTAIASAGYATSPDGVNWTSRTLPASGSFAACCYGLGLFFVFAAGSSSYYTSVDGLGGWVSRSLPVGGNWEPHAALQANGRLLLLGNSSNVLLSSLDGISWSQHLLPSLPNGQYWRAVHYQAGGYVAVASGGNTAITSPDLQNWTVRSLPFNGGALVLPLNGNWLVASAGTPQVALSNASAFDIVYPQR